MYLFDNLYAAANKGPVKKNYIYFSKLGEGTSCTRTEDQLALLAKVIQHTQQPLRDQDFAESLVPYNTKQFLPEECTKGLVLVNPTMDQINGTNVNQALVLRGRYHETKAKAPKEVTTCTFDYGFGFVCGKALNEDGICTHGHACEHRDVSGHMFTRTFKLGNDVTLDVIMANGEIFEFTSRDETTIMKAIHNKLAEREESTQKVTAVRAICAIANIDFEGQFFDVKVLRTRTGWKYVAMKPVTRMKDGTMAPMRDIAPNFYLRRHNNMKATFTSGNQNNATRSIRIRSSRF